MKQLINQAAQTVAEKASADFMTKVKNADGFVPKYDGRPDIVIGIPWRVCVQNTLDNPKLTEEIGIGVVASIDKITDHCWIVYADEIGDHRIDHVYIVEV